MSLSGAIRAGRAFVELGVKNNMTRPLRRAQARLRAFASTVNAIGRTMLISSIALATPIAFATKTYAEFADEMAAVKAISGATSDEFERLEAQARKLGRSTTFFAAQVADAQKKLARAGFSPDEIIDATPAILNLARATGTELPLAAQIAAASLRQFKLDASETGRVSDVLTATSNGSAQTLEDLGEALKFVAPLAVEAGAELEDTAAAIGILADSGLRGTVAGTQLARAYKNLSNRRIRQALKDATGVDSVDAENNLRPIAEILAEIGVATKDLGSGDRLAIFEQIFGRGEAGALKLSKMTGGFEELLEKIRNSQGVAKETADIMDDTLGGAFLRLSSAIGDVQIAIGKAIEGELRAFVEAAALAGQEISIWINKNQEFIVGAVKVIALVGALGVAFMGLGVAASIAAFMIGAIISIMSSIVTVITAISAGVSILSGVAVPLIAIMAVFAALSAATIAFGVWLLFYTEAGGQALAWLSSQFKQLSDSALPIIDGIREALAAKDIQLAAQILWAGLEVAWLKGIAKVIGIWEGFKFSMIDIFDTMLTTFLKTWNQASAIIAKGILKLQGKLDKSFDSTLAIKFLDEDTKRKNKKIDKAAQNRRDKRFEKGAKAIEEADKEVKRAQEELDALLSQASRKKRGTPGSGSFFFELPGEVEEKNNKAGAVFKSVASRGTFNSAAAQLLGLGGGVSDRIVKATERTADATEELVEEFEAGGGIGA